MKMRMGKEKGRPKVTEQANYRRILSLDGKDSKTSWLFYPAKHSISCRNLAKVSIPLRQR